MHAKLGFSLFGQDMFGRAMSSLIHYYLTLALTVRRKAWNCVSMWRAQQKPTYIRNHLECHDGVIEPHKKSRRWNRAACLNTAMSVVSQRMLSLIWWLSSSNHQH